MTIDMASWSDDELRRAIHETKEEIERLKDTIEMLSEALDQRAMVSLRKKLEVSRPYLEEALAYLETHGHTIVSDTPLKELGDATYWAIFPPRQDDGYVFWRRYWGTRDEALLEAAVGILGDLSVWAAERQ